MNVFSTNPNPQAIWAMLPSYAFENSDRGLNKVAVEHLTEFVTKIVDATSGKLHDSYATFVDDNTPWSWRKSLIEKYCAGIVRNKDMEKAIYEVSINEDPLDDTKRASNTISLYSLGSNEKGFEIVDTNVAATSVVERFNQWCEEIEFHYNESLAYLLAQVYTGITAGANGVVDSAVEKFQAMLKEYAKQDLQATITALVEMPNGMEYILAKAGL